MKILVTEMPKKKEACLFYKTEIHTNRNVPIERCTLNGKVCSFKNGDSIFGGECRCLRVGLTRD